MNQQARVTGNRDFQKLWTGLAISQVGSAVGMVALPIVAITVVQASTLQISLLAAVTAVTTILIAFPMGTYVEFRPKRPVMIAADLARFVSLVSIPIAVALDVMTFAHLCVVAAINAMGQIAFTSASQANLIGLVSRNQLVDANGKLQSTNWLSLSVGPSVGGILIGFLGTMGTLVIDGISNLFSALAIWRIRTPEPPAPERDTNQSRRHELIGGLHFAWKTVIMRRLLISWVTFAGTVGMATPISTVFYLRDLNFTPWQYGVILGVPSLGGFFGARMARRASSRLGMVPALWWASVLRGPWYFLIPFAVTGTPGLIMCCVGFTGVLFFSAMANSSMAGYRQLMTPDHLMSRVGTLWSFATTLAQPVFIVAGGIVASWVGARTSLIIVAVIMCLSAFILPRHDNAESDILAADPENDRTT